MAQGSSSDEDTTQQRSLNNNHGAAEGTRLSQQYFRVMEQRSELYLAMERGTHHGYVHAYITLRTPLSNHIYMYIYLKKRTVVNT